MSSAERACCLCCAALAAFLLPGVASAHVGKTAPTATNFDARIGGVRPASGAVQAKVVDGDSALWLRVEPNVTVLIPGTLGEPLLRFDRHGVFLNLRSLTAESDRIDRFDLKPDPNPHAPPLWHRVSAGHAYLWHEHRLHVREPLARGHTSTTVLGPWSVPLLIDGKPHALVGVLVYHPPASVWPWILIAAALALGLAAAGARGSPTRRRLIPLAALPAVPLVWALRIGRELYGRPDVAVVGYVEIALTTLVGLALLYGLLCREGATRTFTAFLVAFGCLYQGFTMLAVLTHAVALTTLPAGVAQPAVAAILGLGAGLLALTMREPFGSNRSDEIAAVELAAAGATPPLERAGRP